MAEKFGRKHTMNTLRKFVDPTGVQVTRPWLIDVYEGDVTDALEKGMTEWKPDPADPYADSFFLKNRSGRMVIISLKNIPYSRVEKVGAAFEPDDATCEYDHAVSEKSREYMFPTAEEIAAFKAEQAIELKVNQKINEAAAAKHIEAAKARGATKGTLTIAEERAIREQAEREEA